MTGIVGVYEDKNATINAYLCLANTQTRGQENCGIAVGGDESLRVYNGKRLLSSVFHPDILKSYNHPGDYAAIGNVGDQKVHRDKIQPTELVTEYYKVAVVLDGFILNHDEMENKLELTDQTDAEIFGNIFLNCLEETDDVIYSCKKTMEELDQAYFSAVMLLHDEDRQRSKLIAMRDKRGVRPMYMGRTEHGLYITSESGAIDNMQSMGMMFLEKRDVIPGEMLKADPKISSYKLMEPKRAHCIFEWIYTARPDAVLEGQTAHVARKRTGHKLVELYGIKPDKNKLVIGIPDSGRSVALGIAEKAGISFDEAIIKNQYIGRTYVIPDSVERKLAASLKHNTIKAVTKGKDIIFGDDSIVRGTISEAVARTLKNAGAKKVSMAISYGPIYYPCFSDEADKVLATDEFDGDKNDVVQVGKYVAENLPSIDEIMYNSVENVIEAIGLPEDHLCTFCMTGKDPFKK